MVDDKQPGDYDSPGCFGEAYMKINSKDREDSNMESEYDFRGGVRGKHHEAYRKGHTVKVHREDQTVIVQHFSLEEGAVMLEPDVRAYFGDSESVNKALRTLIDIVPKKRRTSIKPR